MTATPPVPTLNRQELDLARQQGQAYAAELPAAYDMQPGEDSRRGVVTRDGYCLIVKGLAARDWKTVELGAAVLQQGDMFRIRVRRPFNLGGKLTQPGDTIYAALPVAYNRVLEGEAEADDAALIREMVTRGYGLVRFNTDTYTGGGASQPAGSTAWLPRGDAQQLAIQGRVELIA